MRDESTAGRAGQAFLLALGIAAAIFLPFVVIDRGYFIYYGDFNVQQIPFYQLAHEAVRSGGVYWSWFTDLGANFIGSYSFYLLFSPFFWLTLPFPTEAVPFLMAPLLILKTACASLTAYLYLERFVKDRRYAVIAALLYAFSGWMDFNIFFNHFHEPAILFPLMLLGVEKLVTENKKCLFALTVAVNAMVNYWFFVGGAVFVMLYVFVRMTDKTWRMSAAKFARLVFEAVLGVGLAAVVLMPSVMALMGNPRTGLSELANGWNAWLYWHEQRPVAILQSLIFPPELPARPNFLPDHGAKWSSLSAWLPMFSLTGVLAYFFGRQNDWLKKLLALCLVFSLVPWLNSLFILLNDSYYARWFYMPLLLMALATVRALEDSARGTVYFSRSIKWVGVAIAVFAVMSGVTPMYEQEELTFGLAHDLPLMWVYVGIALIGLLVTAAVTLHMRYSRNFLRLATTSVAIFSAVFAIFFIACGKSYFERGDFVVNTAIKGRDEIQLPDGPFARSDAYDAQDNLLMFWHLPNIQAFHSIVPASIMEFYPSVGVKRDVGSRPEPEFAALRPLLSVRWLFIEDNEEKDQEPMPGYTLYDTQVGFNIYENNNFIPMGFSYDNCISRDQLEAVTERRRSNMMLKAVVLEEEDIYANMDILKRISTGDSENFSEIAMAYDAEARREFAADTFDIDNHGFTATTSFDQDRLIFFSVPWEKGWSASVNGEPADIIRANIGFMAVRVPAGAATVRFDFFPPGLVTGALISAAFLFLFMAYLTAVLFTRRKAVPVDLSEAALTGRTVEMSPEEYFARFGDRAARAANLQRTINEAAARHMPEELGDEEKTFRFSIDKADTQENNGNNVEIDKRDV